MEDKITVKRALEITVDLLGRIKVPVSMYEEIGSPIQTAIKNLKVCIDAHKEAPVPAPEETVEEEPEASESEN